MTIAEVIRHIEAFNKIKKIESQEKASYDYILASLIVKGFSITMGGKDKYPTIEEAYSGMFDEIKEEREEKIQATKNELSVLRFKQFAQYHNNKNNMEVLTDK